MEPKERTYKAPRAAVHPAVEGKSHVEGGSILEVNGDCEGVTRKVALHEIPRDEYEAANAMAIIAWEAQQIARLDVEAAEARTRLVAAMKEAYGPHTLQKIGEAAGLSRQRVEQLIKKEEK